MDEFDDLQEPSTISDSISIVQASDGLPQERSGRPPRRRHRVPAEPELSESDEYVDYNETRHELIEFSTVIVGEETETSSAVQSIQQVVVLADPSAPLACPSSSGGLTNITVTPISSHPPAQFTSLQPVAVGHLTAGERPLSLDSSILTVTFDTVSGSALLHNRPPELVPETVGPGGGSQSVAHFINVTTLVNPLGVSPLGQLEAWRPVPEGQVTHMGEGAQEAQGQGEGGRPLQSQPPPHQSGSTQMFSY